MKEVSADDSSDGFDNKSLKNKIKTRIVLQNLRVKRKDQLMKLGWNNTRAQRKRLAQAIIPSTFSLVKQLF